ncbi:hypothetical protein JdFRA1000001_33c [uncultured archaeal virus]|jgi:hypothetical protein|uniref:Uncharacterized protein n=1 Tax=uncultured archaeal virus TaxID=1960247 RepID=A0A1S5Y2Y0_9VIRU|nr:hypothetical protein JdFRA1000001_33c [uncultured archaeal virus]
MTDLTIFLNSHVIIPYFRGFISYPEREAFEELLGVSEYELMRALEEQEYQIKKVEQERPWDEYVLERLRAGLEVIHRVLEAKGARV